MEDTQKYFKTGRERYSGTNIYVGRNHEAVDGDKWDGGEVFVQLLNAFKPWTNISIEEARKAAAALISVADEWEAAKAQYDADRENKTKRILEDLPVGGRFWFAGGIQADGTYYVKLSQGTCIYVSFSYSDADEIKPLSDYYDRKNVEVLS